MSVMRGPIVIALVGSVACGGEARLGEVPAQGGGGAAETIAGSSSAVSAGGGGASSAATSGSGGHGGAGGGAAPMPRLVTVLAHEGTPESSVEVVAHDGDGVIVDQQLTGLDGKAIVTVADDGMITLGYEHIEVLPDGNGGSITDVERRLFTFAQIGPELDLVHRLTRPRLRIRNDPMTLEIVASVSSVNNLWVAQTCPRARAATEIIPAMGSTLLNAWGCDGETEIEVVVVALGGGRATFGAVNYQPGTTATLVVTDQDLAVPPTAHVFDAPAPHKLSVMATANDSWGNLRAMTHDHWGLVVAGPFHMGAAPSVTAPLRLAELAIKSDLHTLRYRTLASIPAYTSWIPDHLAESTDLVATSAVVEEPQLSWSFQGPGLPGDAVEVMWWTPFWPDAIPRYWSFWLPAGSTSASFPAMPPSLAGYVPPGISTSITIRAVAAHDPGLGRKDLFEFELEDRTLTSGATTWYPLDGP
jgi:hypothetical protein